MARQSPYLQRRGDAFSFRIAIPIDLRSHLGCREFVRALDTSDKVQAIPRALALASRSRRLFWELREAMKSDDKSKLMQLLQAARLKYALIEQQEEHEAAIASLKEQHRRELAAARTAGVATGLASAIKGIRGVAPSSSGTPTPKSSNAPKLGQVIEGFVRKFNPNKEAMLAKHESVLPLFLQVVGDRPVDTLRQADINQFFALVQKLPPRWRDQVERQKISPVALATVPHPKTIAPKTFEDTYKACVRSFLEAARRDWSDEGFPVTLSTDGIEYTGDREDGEGKQRAFKATELKRLFEGDELRSYGAHADTSHKYWLPHIGLFTGARVNEICQLNPQTDISDDGGIWHFRFTEETESAPGIVKSIKNKASVRRVPVHSHLIELGFKEFVKGLRKAGQKQLFPEWPPKRGKASPKAETWFRRFLTELGLRDETPGARLVGMHAFRHTILTRANDLGVERAIEITGHAGEDSAVVRGYRDELALERKQEILERITYDLDLRKVAPGSLPARRAQRGRPRNRT